MLEEARERRSVHVGLEGQGDEMAHESVAGHVLWGSYVPFPVRTHFVHPAVLRRA